MADEAKDVDIGIQTRKDILGDNPYAGDLATGQAIDELQERNKHLIKTNESLEQANVRDPLTGLFNKGYFDRKIAEVKPDDEISIVTLDIDNFKRNVNDKYGHIAGDKVIKSISRILQSDVQIVGNGNVDTVARVGGEEFSIIFRGLTDRELLEKRAEQIRSDFQSSFVEDNGIKISTTISLGVAIKKPGEEAIDVVRRADRALYVAKETGRNKVVVSEENV